MSRTSTFPRFDHAGAFGGSSKSNKFNIKALLDFSDLTPTVQKHLANVYTCLLISAASAAAGVYLSMTGWLNFPILAFFGSLITSIWLGLTELNAATQRTCFALLSVNALFIGIYISPLISLAVQIDPQIVMTAVMAASLIFACFSLSALYAKRRTYLYLGGLLGAGVSFMIMLSFMNIFLRSQLIFNIHLYLGLAIACGYVLFDTQLIVERANSGDMNYVKHSLLLFIDLVDIFVRILIILMKNSEQKKQKSNNR